MQVQSPWMTIRHVAKNRAPMPITSSALLFLKVG